MTEFQAAIANAIREKTLVRFATEARQNPGLAADEARLLDEALTVCERVRSGCRQHARSVERAFGDAGIDFRLDEAALRETQIDQIRVDIIDRDPTAAVCVALDLGFASPIPLDSAAWEIHRRRGRSLVMRRADGDMMRLVIKWQPSVSASGLPLGLWPNIDDVSILPLPSRLWFLGFAVRPFAVAARRIGWRLPSASLGESLETPPDLISALLAFAEVSPSDRLADIGCGSGRVLTVAASEIGCAAVGYELDASLCEAARARVCTADVDSLVEIREQDALDAELDGISVVFLFLPPETVAKLVPRLLGRLQPGARVLAHEQLPLECRVAPTRSRVLFGERSLTVGYLWVNDYGDGAPAV